MSSLRRQHGGGRDFLEENKQRVSKMETNGRCLAAANARRVPFWRPVVLHYGDRMRPHPYCPRRVQQASEMNAAGDLAYPQVRSPSGRLTSPDNRYEFFRRPTSNQMEDPWAQGGWVDPRRRQRPMRRSQSHQPPEVPAQALVPPRQVEEDQTDHMSKCLSRLSLRSQGERSIAGEDKAEPETPLSARSRASAVTLKSKRSVSQESYRSNVTVKSDITVASNITNASHKSTASNMTSASKNSSASKHTIASKNSHSSRKMEVMPPPDNYMYEQQQQHQHQPQHQPQYQQQHQHQPQYQYQEQHQPQHQYQHQHQQHQQQQQQQAAYGNYEGYTPLTKSERQAARVDAEYKYGKLLEEYNHLPVSASTLRVRSRRIAIEKQLDELDYNINMFDQPHMDMYYKR